MLPRHVQRRSPHVVLKKFVNTFRLKRGNVGNCIILEIRPAKHHFDLCFCHSCTECSLQAANHPRSLCYLFTRIGGSPYLRIESAFIERFLHCLNFTPNADSNKDDNNTAKAHDEKNTERL